ncbi:hypothetical protein D3C71_77380 [compost metagenome]
MSQEFEIKITDEFKFFAELQLAMHEYAVNVKPGVKPEWFQGADLGLTVTMRALPGMMIKTKVSDILHRHVIVSRGEADRYDPAEIYVGFYQTHDRMHSSYTKLFEKDQGIVEHRAVTENEGSMTQLCTALAEDIFQFLFTAEVPDVITY